MKKPFYNRKCFKTLVLFLFPFFIFGQRDVSEKINTPYISIQYGINWTGGDLAERYGFTNAIGSFLGYKTKRNWVFGLDGNFLFGNKIKIDGLMQNLLDGNGQLINSSGVPSDFATYNRGFNFNLAVSKIFPVFGPNPNSGLMLQIGAGFLWHKVKIEANYDEVPQIDGDYRMGYDRLTSGFSVSEFIGYNFMANRGIINFYAGVYFMHGFTHNQREIFWDHPNEKADKGLRIEHLFGIRAGWLIPIYKREAKDYYFN